MSLRLHILNLGLRLLVKPKLRRTKSPEHARRDFDRIAPRAFRQPPFLRQVVTVQGGSELHWIRAGTVRPGKCIYYIHGGAYLAGSPSTHRGLAGRISKLSGVECCLPKYCLLQDAPFPAAFDDVLAGWERLMAMGYAPNDIVLGGDSAGGGLMLALLGHLCRAGSPPAGAFAFSPWTDLTLSGETIKTNAASDSILPVSRMEEAVEYYLGDAPRDDPRASPLFAQYPSPPPVMIQAGSGEVLLNDSERMAAHLRQHGAEVSLEIWPNAPHVWQIFDGALPEARQALRRVAGFVQSSLDDVIR